MGLAYRAIQILFAIGLAACSSCFSNANPKYKMGQNCCQWVTVELLRLFLVLMVQVLNDNKTNTYLLAKMM
jgi:hypothetical protein